MTSKLINRAVLAALFCLAVLASPVNVFAADSCPSASSLKDCLEMNIQTCRDDASCSSDREQAIAASDVVAEVESKCCSKNKPSKCVKKQKKKYRRGLRGLPPFLKPFLRQVVSDIKAIDCSTNSEDE